MSYRNTVEVKVGNFVVGQYVIFPTTGNGSWSGIFVGFGEPLGQYAREGEVNVMVRDEDTGRVHTLRSSRLYSGYMAPVVILPEEEEEEEAEPVLRTYEILVPVEGEVIFTVEAYSEEEARRMWTDGGLDFTDGELNVMQSGDDDMIASDILD